MSATYGDFQKRLIKIHENNKKHTKPHISHSPNPMSLPATRNRGHWPTQNTEHSRAKGGPFGKSEIFRNECVRVLCACASPGRTRVKLILRRNTEIVPPRREPFNFRANVWRCPDSLLRLYSGTARGQSPPHTTPIFLRKIFPKPLRNEFLE